MLGEIPAAAAVAGTSMMPFMIEATETAQTVLRFAGKSYPRAGSPGAKMACSTPRARFRPGLSLTWVNGVRMCAR
jgi:hypothetical protein